MYRKSSAFSVGLGPSHAPRASERVPLAMSRALQQSRGTGPRPTKKTPPSPSRARKNSAFIVGRGPVPRHRSHAIQHSQGTGPRPTKKTSSPSRRAWALGCHMRMRAGFPRHRFRARPCRSGSPDPDPFGSGRSRTTEVGPMPAGIRLPTKAG